jgi:hypothetical protein
MTLQCQQETLPMAVSQLSRFLYRTCVSIGEISVGLSGASIEDICLDQEMSLFQVPAPSCDIEITVERVPSLHPLATKKYFDSGGLWAVHEDGDGFAFDVTTPVFGADPYKRLCVDRQFRRASILVSRQCFPDNSCLYPLEYPLDELLIMHRLACEKGIEFHACGLVDAERGGFLFLGHSTAGKSTTTRLWKSLRDVTVLSDDRIIVRRNDSQTWMYGTPWHGEAAFALPGKATIKRIVVIEHGPENRIELLPKSRAVAEMFARCFVPFYNNHYLENTLAYLNELADSVPCYRYRFLPEPSAVEKVLNFDD